MQLSGSEQTLDLIKRSPSRQHQVNHIALITFWSQFSVYAFNTVLILFLTRSLSKHGLGYSDSKAYAFMGVTYATSYIMPLLGGNMADKVLGLRRSIMLGSVLLAVAYLLVMLSGMTTSRMGDTLFIAAYALIPVTNSLLMGTSSALVSRIYQGDEAKAKSGMTLYYMAINVGSLLATFISPMLLDSRYGPLSVFAVVFIGKSIAALNFSLRLRIYDNVVTALDKCPLVFKQKGILCAYLCSLYCLTLVGYLHPYMASNLIGVSCAFGLCWFFLRTCRLDGISRVKQLIAVFLIVEAVVFFVIYNQMNTTLVLFAKSNSNLNFLGLHVSSAHYQMINPILIILLSFVLPAFYQRFKQFTIPFQFAAGTGLSGLALLVLAYAGAVSVNDLIEGNYIALTYGLLTIAELWVSAVGLSMIGLYCEKSMLAFAMGVWYLSCSLSNVISSKLAQWVAIPSTMSAHDSMLRYTNYYFDLGLAVLLIACVMLVVAKLLQQRVKRLGVII